MSNELRIQRMLLPDATEHFDRIVDLLQELYKSQREVYPSLSVDRGFLLRRCEGLVDHLRTDGAFLWGGFDDSELVGFLWGYERSFVGEQRMHITEFVVTESLRGHGLGRLLLDVATAEARRLNFSAVDLLCSVHTRDTLRFYDKAGFIAERCQLIKRLDGE